MENYRSNSNKSKQEERKKAEKVVVSGAAQKGTGGKGGFFKSTVESVGRYLLHEILVPALKKTVDSMITNGSHMFLYGEASKRDSRGPSPVPKVSYRSAYDDRRSDYAEDDAGSYKGYNYGTVLLSTRGDAEDVLDRLAEIVGEFGVVSVADLYEMCGLDTDWTDANYGWTSVRNVQVARNSDGYYTLRMSRPSPINERRR